jgi:hypothetical protein
MIKACPWGISLIVMGFASSVSAQMAPPPSASSNTPPAAMMMNPYLNPYMNPLINPGAPQQNMSVGNNLLYLYSAQAARGGIGSGRLSNPGTSNARKRAATIPNSASVPGGAASHYFNNSRSGSKTGARGYFNQRGGNFQHN